MIIRRENNIVILHRPGIELGNDCFANIEKAMKFHRLDSCCPIEPSYHRRYGIFECNLFYPYNSYGVELTEFCVAMKTEVWEKISNFDLHHKNFMRLYLQVINDNKLKHGLVCNALIYGGN